MKVFSFKTFIVYGMYLRTVKLLGIMIISSDTHINRTPKQLSKGLMLLLILYIRITEMDTFHTFIGVA